MIRMYLQRLQEFGRNPEDFGSLQWRRIPGKIRVRDRSPGAFSHGGSVEPWDNRSSQVFCRIEVRAMSPQESSATDS